MFRTALNFYCDDSKELRIITPTEKMSQRYTYLSKTTIIEDEDNEGKIYDYIDREDLDDKIFLPDNELMQKFLKNEHLNIDICVRLEKYDDGYLIRSMLAAPKSTGMPTDSNNYYDVLDENQASVLTAAMRMLYALGSKTASIEKSLGRKKISPDHEIYEIAKDIFGNLMTIKIDYLPMLSDLDEESLITNILKVDHDDQQMFRGMINLLYGQFSTAYYSNANKLIETLGADDWLFFDTYIRPNPLCYKNFNDNLDTLINRELSKVDDDM